MANEQILEVMRNEMQALRQQLAAEFEVRSEERAKGQAQAVTQMVQRVLAEAATVRTPTAMPRPHIETFDGNPDKLDSWVFRLELLTERASDDERILIAQQHLTGPALTWLQQRRLAGAEEPQDWRTCFACGRRGHIARFGSTTGRSAGKNSYRQRRVREHHREHVRTATRHEARARPGLPPHRDVDHKIELQPDATPTCRAPYRLGLDETEELDKFAVAFLDDVLIYSATAAEHEQHVRLVLEVLRKAKLARRTGPLTHYHDDRRAAKKSTR